MSDQDEPKMLRDKIAQIYSENDELIKSLMDKNRQLEADNAALRSKIERLSEELNTATLRLAERT